MNTLWQYLEEIPGLIALVPVWQELLGVNLQSFQSLCLVLSPRIFGLLPCPVGRDCAYNIVPQPPGSATACPFMGYCETDPPICQDRPFSAAEVTPLELDWRKLGRALCHAFHFDIKFVDLPIFHTVQIGTWSADAIPVILTIQIDSIMQRFVILELIARLNQKFILL